MLDYDAIPLSNAGKWLRDNMPSLFQECISGGDDYELLFSAPPATADALHELAVALKVPLTRIGKIIAGNGVHLQQSGCAFALSHEGYVH